jgi:hypothetical protein
MTIRLLAHIHKGSTLAALAGGDQPPPSRPLALARWVLEELVVGRFEPLPWRPRPRRAPSAASARDLAEDSSWADTQPCCYDDPRLDAARRIRGISVVPG